jgi:hypothetical protein
MKIKVGKDYQNTLSTNYMRDWMMQLYNNKEIEIIVNRDDFADIGINTNINVTLSFYINFSDPHSLSFYDINNLINQKWTNLIKDKNKLINYSLLNINNNCSIEKINTYNYYAPIVYDCSTHLIDKIKAKLIHWNHSLPQDIFFINTKIKRINDVYFSGSIRENSYPLRKLIYDEIKQHFEIKSIINNVSGRDVKNFAKKDTNDDISKQNEKYKLQLINYAGNLRLSKLTLFDGGIFDYPVKKFYESMACGCLVLAPKPLDADYLGFIDNETYVQIDENNFMDKVKFYLNNDKERERITKNAYNLYLERFTIEKDVEKFINFCKQELNNITNTEKDSKYYDRIYLKSQLDM